MHGPMRRQATQGLAPTITLQPSGLARLVCTEEAALLGRLENNSEHVFKKRWCVLCPLMLTTECALRLVMR